MTIYNHDLFATDSGAAGLQAAELYSARALGLSRPEDVLQLPPEAAPEHAWAIRHYRRMGIECADQTIWNLDPSMLRWNQHHSLSVYFFGSELNEVCPDKEWFQTVRLMNSKNFFYQVCSEIGLPLPRTECFNDAAEFNGTAIEFPLVVKLDCSASGLGVWKCSSKSELEKVLSRITGTFQIQENLDAIEWLNVQYEGDGSSATLLATTAQVLSELAYQGNRYPTEFDPRTVTDPIANWMAERGMKGIFAIDVAVCPDGDGPPLYKLIEANPRYNGSTYYFRMAERLGTECWIGKNFQTRRRSFRELDLDGLAYGVEGNYGAVVVNWATIREGHLGILLAGTKDQQNALEQELLSIL